MERIEFAPFQEILAVAKDVLLFSFLFFVSWGGVRLSPPGTPATNWPIVPTPDER
jgi:hypothetical protein